MKRAIGIDLVEVARFKKFKKAPKDPFLYKVFTERELAYCFSYTDAATHLAGTFAAKEAASKALGTARFPLFSLEIRRAPNGAPAVYKAGKRLAIVLSITHTRTLAAAVAMR